MQQYQNTTDREEEHKLNVSLPFFWVVHEKALQNKQVK